MKIAIIGYYGHNNLGDELNLLEILKLVKHQRPDADITVFSGGLAYLYYETEYPLVLADPLGLKEYRRVLNTFDLIIIGGGGIVFLGANYFNFLLEGITAPYIFSRVGIDDRIISESACSELRSILKKASDVTVRTKQDNALASKHLGISCDVIPEAIWNYQAEHFQYVYGGNIILVDINRYAAKFASGISKALAGIQTPHTICTVSMQDSADDFYYNILSTPKRIIMPEAVSLHKKASFLAAAGIVVTSRLHAGLIAVSHGVPTIFFKSTPKIEYLAHELDIDTLYFDHNPDSSQIEAILSERSKISDELLEKSTIMKEKASADIIRV